MPANPKTPLSRQQWNIALENRLGKYIIMSNANQE